ncbi:MAG: hypothetical protein R2941_18545 [Desulfobacterales bacterium]
MTNWTVPWRRELGLTEPLPDAAASTRHQSGQYHDDLADGVSLQIVPGWIFYITFVNVRIAFHSEPGSQACDFALCFDGNCPAYHFTVDKTPFPDFSRMPPAHQRAHH